MVRRLSTAVALCFIASLPVLAQVGTGSLKGKITDKKTNEPLPFVNIVVENRGSQVTGGATDFDGNYFIKPIDPGTYDVVVSYVGYQPYKQTGVVVNSNIITFLNIQLNAGIELKEFEVVQYTVPLINKDGGASGGTVTREDIAKMPGRSASSIATTVAGASDAGTGGGISIRGARSEATYYYIDGVKVPAGAGTGLPKGAIEEVQVITGGVPANYGDVTGGLINITTRGPSRQFFGGAEYLTSGFKVGKDITDIVGLDKFAFNQLEASVSGPLLFRKDSLGNKSRPLIGFFLSGQYTNAVDNGPSYLGDVRLKPDVRDRILANPGTLLSTGNGDVALVNSSEFIRAGDVESIPTRQNAGEAIYTASGKIDIATSQNVQLTVGGSLDYSNRQSFNRNNSLLNADRNTRTKELSWRAFIKYTQRFANRTSEEEKKSTIKNAFYSLQFDYSRYQNDVQDYVHGDRLFDYGYIGRFTTYRAPQFELQGSRWVQVGVRDTLVTFAPGTQNPYLAAFDNYYFNALPREQYPITRLFGLDIDDGSYLGYYQDRVETESRGVLWNGTRPVSLYSMWNNPGFIDDPDGAEFRKRLNEQVRFTAVGSADIGQHAVMVGIEYEQLTQRRYNLEPVGLWTRARQLANFHLENFKDPDENNADYIVVLPNSTFPFHFYDRLYSDIDNRFFSRNLRTSLGLDVQGTDFVDVDELDPSALSLDMFEPDELINSGNSTLASFVGYDYLGNKLTSKPSFDDFFTERNDRGSYTRAQAPFQPIYMAGYLMDKFAFDDIIFNVGVRVDRYDANQNVLKDKYLWREAYKAGDAVPSSGIQNQLSNRPSNIGEDFVVYVDDYDDPFTVRGYRDGDTWYSANGTELSDGNSIQQGGRIKPYLIGGDDRSDLAGTSPLSRSAFKDYVPVVNVMPRVAFSFPISDEAVFFAHYDVLTQRPNANQSRGDLVSYAYIENDNPVLNNPNLKPTKTIDYELGFQQVLGKASSLKIALFYRELRDQIQVRNVVNAWPRDYRTYDNFDFGTVKGLTTTYDLRRTGNLWMRASYTLQFADGTGSGPNTGINLINSGQPNLRNISPLDFDQRHRFQITADFRYGRGKDYNGPMLFGKPVFQGMGINAVAILGSGTPYSRSSQVVSEATGASNYRLDGTLNGARLPWQFTTDMQIDRDIPLTFGGKDGDKAKSADLNVYLLITNVFNTENITGVYRYTGSPNNDGYLAQLTDRTQTDPDAYRDLYQIKNNSPGNYGAPRTIRLGLRISF